MNYPVLGAGVLLMLLAGAMFGMDTRSNQLQIGMAAVGLALAVFAVFFHGGGQKLTGGKKIKDNWV